MHIDIQSKKSWKFNKMLSFKISSLNRQFCCNKSWNQSIDLTVNVISALYLWQLSKIPPVDLCVDALVGVCHVLSDEGEGVGHGQQREQLVLLRLVVQNLRLWLSGKKKKRVGSNNKVIFFFLKFHHKWKLFLLAEANKQKTCLGNDNQNPP